MSAKEPHENFEFQANILAGEESVADPLEPPEGIQRRQIILWVGICVLIIGLAVVSWLFIQMPDCENPANAWSPCFAPLME